MRLVPQRSCQRLQCLAGPHHPEAPAIVRPSLGADRVGGRVLQRLKYICERVAGYFKGDAQKTFLWFSLPNTLLGGISPIEMIKLGRYKKLYHFVQNALAGNNP